MRTTQIQAIALAFASIIALTALVTGLIGTISWAGQAAKNKKFAILSGPFEDGELLIGNGTTGELVINTLTAGAGIAVTNGPGTVQVGIRPPVVVNVTDTGAFSEDIPAGATWVLVTAVGGGGGGGSGSALGSVGGGGGGGGAVVKDYPVRLANIAGPLVGFVGIGGVGAPTVAVPGNAGLASFVDVGYLRVIGYGGGGGRSGDGGDNGNGGGGGGSNGPGVFDAGGPAYTGSNTPNAGLSLAGGAGAVRDTSAPANAIYGGMFFIAGAGGGAGSVSDPTAGGNFAGGGVGGAPGAASGGGAAGYTGNGGAGGDTNGSVGLDGVGRGAGGGGGGIVGGLGGDGAPGMVTLTFLFH